MGEEEEKDKILPCVDCITLPVCKSIYHANSPGSIESRVILEKRCSILHEYISVFEGVPTDYVKCNQILYQFHRFMLSEEERKRR